MRKFLQWSPNSPLKNYLRWQYCVKKILEMLIYSSKFRFLGSFCLVLPASPTFFQRPVKGRTGNAKTTTPA
jgi:hypothetical protein